MGSGEKILTSEVPQNEERLKRNKVENEIKTKQNKTKQNKTKQKRLAVGRESGCLVD